MRQPFSNSPAGTIAEVLCWAASELASHSDSARLDSEVLLAHALNLARSGLIARLRDECPNEGRDRFEQFIARRKGGEPVAYIVGEREFYGLSFIVTPDVLVPRPESELVVDEALRALAGKSEASVLDLGTGSGCLAIAIVSELQRRGVIRVECDAVDRSPQALRVAKANAERLAVSDRIHFIEGDWNADTFAPGSGYDCIVANPPYIDPRERVPQELTFEPAGALFSDDEGLRDTAVILQKAIPLLRSDGVLLCEVGARKRGCLPRILTQVAEGHQISLLGDDSAQDRFCVVRVGPK